MTPEWACLTVGLLAFTGGYAIGRAHGLEAGKLHLLPWAKHAAVCLEVPASKGRACTCGLIQAMEEPHE